jgi:hypothetical protein
MIPLGVIKKKKAVGISDSLVSFTFGSLDDVRY